MDNKPEKEAKVKSKNVNKTKSGHQNQRRDAVDYTLTLDSTTDITHPLQVGLTPDYEYGQRPVREAKQSSRFQFFKSLKPYALGGIVSGLQVGIREVSHIVPGVKEAAKIVPDLMADTITLSVASGVTRWVGELWSSQGDPLTKNVFQPMLHILVSCGVAYTYESVIDALGGDKQEPWIIPATVALESVVSPWIELGVEKLCFAAKSRFFQCVSATKNLCDNSKPDIPYRSMYQEKKEEEQSIPPTIVIHKH